jgi:hypothetical protein
VSRMPMSEQDIEKHSQSLRQPSDATFIEKTVADIPVFCSYLEKRLGLTERDPQQFNPRRLTAERTSPDFLEPGTSSVFLARAPDTYDKTFKPTSPIDRSLNLGMTMSQQDDLFKELGAKLNSQNATPNPGFPILSRLSDFTLDPIYETRLPHF